MEASDKLLCNSRIASALLDALCATGDVAGLNRVRRVYAERWVNVRAEATWVPHRILDRAFRATGNDRDFARRVGYALVAGERVGFFLFLGGVATIDKAYRRCDALLAREDRNGRFQTLEVASGKARIVYHPAAEGEVREGEPDRAEWNESFCGVRQGMLEALPLCFGLMPAKVEETQCVGQGAAQCCFEVCFDSRSHSGAIAGLLMGAATAAVLCGSLLVGLPLHAQGIVVGVVTVLSLAAGHAVDLARQLEAVAGARRGHLALLEQADRALAEKMDQLAKLGSRLDGAESQNTDRLRAILEARAEAGNVSSLEATPVKAPSEHGRPQRPVALAEIVTRAADQLRPQLLAGQDLCLEFENELPVVRGDPFQLEQVACQLLKNAAEASPPDGTIRASLRNTPRGIELIIEDQGTGFPDEIAEQVLDPFTLGGGGGGGGDGACDVGGAVGSQGGLGLAICYRIVVEHGGELLLSTHSEQGARVIVILPAE